MLEGPLTDFHKAIILPCFDSKSLAQIAADAAPKLDKIYKWMGTKQYLVGSNLSYLDFMFYECIERA